MNSAVGFCGSNAGRSWTSACSAQYCGVPSGPTRRSNFSGATNIRLVSSKRPGLDAIEPNRKCLAERGTGLFRRANEIRDHGAAGFNNAVAHPAHAAGMLNAILVAEAEIAREIGAHCVGIEHDRIKQRGERIGQGCFAGARQTHD